VGPVVGCIVDYINVRETRRYNQQWTIYAQTLATLYIRNRAKTNKTIQNTKTMGKTDHIKTE